MIEEFAGETLADSDNVDRLPGVGLSKKPVLEDAGFETVADVRDASQEDLAEVDEVGNALAARMKAAAGNTVDTTEYEADVWSRKAVAERIDGYGPEFHVGTTASGLVVEYPTTTAAFAALIARTGWVPTYFGRNGENGGLVVVEPLPEVEKAADSGSPYGGRR